MVEIVLQVDWDKGILSEMPNSRKLYCSAANSPCIDESAILRWNDKLVSRSDSCIAADMDNEADGENAIEHTEDFSGSYHICVDEVKG